MKIGIDARELVRHPTGVGRYLLQILRAWDTLPGAAAHEYILYSQHPLDLVFDNLRVSVNVRRHPRSGVLWEQVALPYLARDADVLFAPGYSGPVLTRVPMVVTIHDVSFAAHPEWFSWREGLRRRLFTRLAARKAVKIITVSDFSKREIVHHLEVPDDRVEVIYSGATSMSAENTGRERMVLFVGSLFTRRHIPELIDGFARMAQHHPEARLEIVGDNRTRPTIDTDAIIARSPARDRIRARAYVPDAELKALYSSASAFAFVSEYEGFALTPLEALGAGVPVLLLETEVAREIYGPGALYVDRPDPALIAQALERLLFSEADRARLLEGGAAQLARYSWPECALRTLQVLLASAPR